MGICNFENRVNRIHGFSLDPILAADMYHRLTQDPRFKDIEIVIPGADGEKVSPADLEAMALDTCDSKLLILDVRSFTLPKLQAAYTKVMGYNRADVNARCFTVLIGDGPAKLFAENADLNSFAPYLAKMRVDYHAAVYFYDPLLHYEYGEHVLSGIDHEIKLPGFIPKRLRSGFDGEDLEIEQLRPYFRAAGVDDDVRAAKQKRRLKRLAKLYDKLIVGDFKKRPEQPDSCRSVEGFLTTGEPLRLNFYPFYFEQWCARLLKKAKAPIAASA